MKRFIADILPRVRQYSKQLDNVALFTEEPWVQVGETHVRTVYYFRREDNELIVSRDGDVTRGTWTYLAPMDSLVIEVAGERHLYNQGFLDETVMILVKDGAPEYLLMANENRFETPSLQEMADHLQTTYLAPPTPGERGTQRQSDSSADDNTTETQEKSSGSPIPLPVLIFILLFVITMFVIALI